MDFFTAQIKRKNKDAVSGEDAHATSDKESFCGH